METQRVVHGDLAARNCLVHSEDSSIVKVKISDFGLSKPLGKDTVFKRDKSKTSFSVFLGETLLTQI